LIGTNEAGTDTIGYAQRSGISIYGGASFNTIGGISEINRNVISSNWSGVTISETGTTNNAVSVNYIGIDVSGQEELPNFVGVWLAGGAKNNSIGVDAGEIHNVISTNISGGVFIFDEDTTNNTVEYNIIGLSADQSDALGNYYGVIIRSSQGNDIAHNLIAHSVISGVVVSEETAMRNSISQNSMYFNNIGIDLKDGAHGGISPPVIIDVIHSTTTSGAMDVIGTACPGCVVEVFESLYAHGEGENYLGDATAGETGTFALAGVVIEDNFITATATNVALGTSEFSSLYIITPTLYLPIVSR
jgi:hypothetical protein